METQSSPPDYRDIVPVAASGIVVAFLASFGKPSENFIHFGIMILLAGVFTFAAAKCLIDDVVRPGLDGVFVVIGVGVLVLAVALNIFLAILTRLAWFSPSTSVLVVTLAILIDVCAIGFLHFLPNFAKRTLALENRVDEERTWIVDVQEKLDIIRSLYMQAARQPEHSLGLSDEALMDDLFRLVRSASPATQSDRSRRFEVQIDGILTEMRSLLRESGCDPSDWKKTVQKVEEMSEDIQEAFRCRENSIARY